MVYAAVFLHAPVEIELVLKGSFKKKHPALFRREAGSQRVERSEWRAGGRRGEIASRSHLEICLRQDWWRQPDPYGVN